MRRISSAILFGFALALVAITAVSAQSPGGSPDGKKMKIPVASSADSIAAGQAFYTKNCRFCHDPDAKGERPTAPMDTHPSDLTDAKWDRGVTDGELFLVLRDGAGPDFKMKGYKGRTSETDMWNVINYLLSIGPKK